jgi:hypothetical protein
MKIQTMKEASIKKETMIFQRRDIMIDTSNLIKEVIYKIDTIPLMRHKMLSNMISIIKKMMSCI